MICPQCKEQGLKSTVQTKGTITTLMGYAGWYDESGKYHHHDDNSRTTVGTCSNGHKFLYRYENSCWCGWVGKTEEYKVINLQYESIHKEG
jgi:hypothetical protein